MLHTAMDTHGTVTKITRRTTSGSPSIRYRFRLGRHGKASFYKTKREAIEHQKHVSKAIQAKGSDVLQVLDKTTLGHVTAALGVLKTSGLNSEHLVQAVRGYTAAISTTALTVTIGEAVDEAFATAKYKALRPSTKRNYRSRWRRLVQYIGYETPLGAVSVFHIEQFLAKQTAGSRHKYYVDLHLLFGVYFVRQLRHMSSNLLDTVVPPQRVEGERRKPYTYTELASILEHVQPFSELDVLLHLNFYTGMRESECYELEGSMIDLGRELIYLPFGFAKNKMDRNSYLTPAIVEYLKACSIPSGRVFKRPLRTLVKQLKVTCKAANVEWKGLTGRITYVSHAYEGLFNSDFHKLQAQVGHSINSKTTLRHYVNAVNLGDVETYFYLPLRRVNEQQWADLVSPVIETE